MTVPAPPLPRVREAVLALLPRKFSEKVWVEGTSVNWIGHEVAVDVAWGVDVAVALSVAVEVGHGGLVKGRISDTAK